jgi:glycosyltransferase involved in cell wall biosynthesis
MKILWISHDSKLGGAELCMLEAVRGFVANGDSVVCVLPTHGAIDASLRKEGAEVAVVPYSWWVHDRGKRIVPFLRTRRLLRHIRSALALRTLMSEVGPDVVITNTVTIPAGALAARLSGIPHIWYLHEFGTKDHGFIFDYGWRPTIALITRLSARVIANSNAVARHFNQAGFGKKMDILYYSVEMPALPPPAVGNHDTVRLVLVGRVCAAKGTADAVRAIGRLTQLGVSAELTLVGQEQNDYGEELRRLAATLGVTKRIKFVGQTSDPAAYMLQADVALMCSTAEAFGRVTVEAMKLALPVIGASVGGTAELIKNGESGLLYPSGDVEALAEAIAHLARDREEARRMGLAAQAWAVQRFTRERYISDLSSTIQRAIKPLGK